MGEKLVFSIKYFKLFTTKVSELNQFGQNFDPKLRNDQGKNSYEHCVYEMVNDRGLS